MKQYSAQKWTTQHDTHLHEGLFVQVVHNYWWDGWKEKKYWRKDTQGL